MTQAIAGSSEKAERCPRRGDVNRARRAGSTSDACPFTNRHLLLAWLEGNGIEPQHQRLDAQALRHLVLTRWTSVQMSVAILGRTLTTDDGTRPMPVDVPEGMAE